MKKNILVALIILNFTSQARSQSVVPNSGMENWHTVTSTVTYENPDGWSSSNDVSAILGVICVTKDTGAFDGTYAARLESKTFFGNTFPGAIGIGKLNIADTTFIGGFPLTVTHPYSLVGYYKFLPQGNDSAFFFAALFAWDAVNQKR